MGANNIIMNINEVWWIKWIEIKKKQSMRRYYNKMDDDEDDDGCSGVDGDDEDGSQASKI
jgi:hypothetical protein